MRILLIISYLFVVCFIFIYCPKKSGVCNVCIYFTGILVMMKVFKMPQFVIFLSYSFSFSRGWFCVLSLCSSALHHHRKWTQRLSSKTDQSPSQHQVCEDCTVTCQLRVCCQYRLGRGRTEVLYGPESLKFVISSDRGEGEQRYWGRAKVPHGSESLKFVISSNQGEGGQRCCMDSSH